MLNALQALQTDFPEVKRVRIVKWDIINQLMVRKGVGDVRQELTGTLRRQPMHNNVSSVLSAHLPNIQERRPALSALWGGINRSLGKRNA